MRCVTLHYGPRYRNWVQSGLQGAHGVVLIQGRGPGPRNVLVRLDDNGMVVVPRWNLRWEADHADTR